MSNIIFYLSKIFSNTYIPTHPTYVYSHLSNNKRKHWLVFSLVFILFLMFWWQNKYLAVCFVLLFIYADLGCHFLFLKLLEELKVTLASCDFSQLIPFVLYVSRRLDKQVQRELLSALKSRSKTTVTSTSLLASHVE